VSSPRREPTSGPRARRNGSLGLAALLGVMIVGPFVSSGGAPKGAVVLTGYGHSRLGPDARRGRWPATRRFPRSESFTISGSVHGLYPGASRALVLTVTNGRAFTVVVTSITTTVKDASPACPESYLSVSPFAGQLTVPSEGPATASVVANLAASAPDGCSGAVFPLLYAGLGRRARP
jgi:hypothetical protein